MLQLEIGSNGSFNTKVVDSTSTKSQGNPIHICIVQKNATENSVHFVLCSDQTLHGLVVEITAITKYRFLTDDDSALILFNVFTRH